MRRGRRKQLIAAGATLAITAGLAIFFAQDNQQLVTPESCVNDEYRYQYPVSPGRELYDPLCADYDKGGNCVKVVEEWEPHGPPFTVWGYVPQVPPPIPPREKYTRVFQTLPGGGGGATRQGGNSGCEVPEPAPLLLIALGVAGLGAVRWASK